MKSVITVKGIVAIDNVYDVINYCAFALILFEEGIHKDMQNGSEWLTFS